MSCENMVSPTSNYTGTLDQVHFKAQLEAVTPIKIIRTKYGMKIGKVQK